MFNQTAHQAPTIKSLRVTVLGPAASGKTCLVNSYVNNTCPNVYTPTEDPTLYYRTLRAERNEELITVLLEIEDTYSSDRTDGQDHFAHKRTVANFIVLKKQSQGYKPPAAQGPFSDCLPPKEDAYDPYSKGRMAFVVLFDVNDMNSYYSAEKVFEELRKRHSAKVDTEIEPVVYLVGNKIDQDPNCEEAVKIRRKVEAWENRLNDSDQKELRFKFMEVSATEFTKVRRLFRNVVEDVLDRTALWQTDADKAAENQGYASTGHTWGMGGLFGGGGPAQSGVGGLFGGLPSLW